MGQTVITSSVAGPVSLSNPETFFKFDIASKMGVFTRDNEFTFVDEDQTRQNFYQQLQKAIVYFSTSKKDKLREAFESNIQFSKKFTVNNMLGELDKLYTEAIKTAMKRQINLNFSGSDEVKG